MTIVYDQQCNELYQRIDFYTCMNSNHQYDKLIEVYTNMLKEAENVRDNSDKILTLNDVEKSLWSDYSSRIDNVIKSLESRKMVV
jgi:hypothetical protein